MSFHGGLIGIILASVIFSKRYNFNKVILLDIVSCVAPIGIFLVDWRILLIASFMVNQQIFHGQ